MSALSHGGPLGIFDKNIFPTLKFIPSRMIHANSHASRSFLPKIILHFINFNIFYFYVFPFLGVLYKTARITIHFTFNSIVEQAVYKMTSDNSSSANPSLHLPAMADIQSPLSPFNVLHNAVIVPEELLKHYQNKLLEHVIWIPNNYVEHMIKCNFIEQFIQVIENIDYKQNNTDTTTTTAAKDATVLENSPCKVVNQKRRYKETTLETDTPQHGPPPPPIKKTQKKLKNIKIKIETETKKEKRAPTPIFFDPNDLPPFNEMQPGGIYFTKSFYDSD